MKSGLVLGAALIAAVAGLGCGPNLTGNPTPPGGPSTLEPLLAPFRAPQISGTWGGPVTLESVAGGAGPARSAGALQCAGRDISQVVGESNDHTLTIAQADISSSAITARLRSVGTGLACTYSGALGAGNSFTLDAETCAAPLLVLRCSEIINDVLIEEVVQLELVGSTITATYQGDVNVTAIQGTAAHSYNVRDASGDPLGGLVTNHSFPVMLRR